MNPEFRRNLWLEFSPHRLIAAPVVIALMLVLVAEISDGDLPRDMARASIWGFSLVVLMWGTYLAGTSVSAEARERTWDTQRMSAIGPWTMTWGKLLGAPAFAWYVGLIALLVYVVCSLAITGRPALRLALFLVLAAVIMHAMALTLSVYAARRHGSHRGANALLLILLLSFGVPPILGIADHGASPVTWWGTAYSAVGFALASAAAFAAWAVLGAYRSMCTALEIRTRPWALPAFTVFAAAWASGLVQAHLADLHAGAFRVLLTGAAISGVACYALLLAEPGGAAAWQRLRVHLRAGNVRRVLEETPLWLIAVGTGLVMGFAAVFTATGSAGPGRLLPLALMLFVLRDAAIFQFFALARTPRRAEAAALFYLGVLYALLPALLFATDAQWLLRLVLPRIFSDTGTGTLVMVVQAGIAIMAARWRWQTVHAPDTGQAVAASR